MRKGKEEEEWRESKGEVRVKELLETLMGSVVYCKIQSH